MAASSLPVKHGWVWACSIFIFFFNTFLLPEGLSYALLLTPVWCYILYLQGRLNIAPVILLPLVVYIPIHLWHGVDAVHYFRSLLMITGLTTFLMVSYYYFNNKAVNWDLIFRDIAILDMLFTLIALCILPFNAINDILWYKVPLTQNIQIPRLKLFTEEASHYSYLLAPIAIYFYCRIMFFRGRRPFLTLLMITIPLILSFSMGVLSCMVISFLIIFLIYFNRIFYSVERKLWFFGSICLVVLALFLLYRSYPHNILFVRIHNIFTGDDTSARGRTYEAFILAQKIIARKSFLWGIGPGQLKLIGRDIIVQFYFYSKIPDVIRIPNATAETIVYFGYMGLVLRMVLEVSFFFITKVYRDPFRSWLFLFAFIYQFTGSYITNAAEYLVWIIAFSSVFPEYQRPVSATSKTGRS